jgi:eukaryotic-like serine/threonine-protein kinase
MGILDSFRKKRHEEKLGEVRPQVHPKNESATAVGWQVGDRIGESYVVLRILGGPGRSGMGIVYVCYDHELRRPLALKTFQDRFLSDKAIVDRFKWEAEAWTRLGRHQNIVWAVWAEVIQGRPFVALEYVSGDEPYGADLSGWIKCGGLRQNDKLDIPLILNFSLQFCHGMMHAKKKFQEIGRPFVHRDVKPSNIMVTQDRVVKVTDFGLVKAFARSVEDMPVMIRDAELEKIGLSKPGGWCGTPPYMSPEQCRGEESIDERSDIYAFGCVLYEMLTGRYVFEAGTVEEFIHHHLRTVPRAPGSGEELDRVVRRCLEKEPNNRYQGFDEVEQVLARLYIGLTGKVVRPIDGAPLEAWEWGNKGLSLMNLGFTDEGMRCTEEAIRINPNCAEAHNNLGIGYAKKGDLDSALREYREALRIDPGYFRAHHNRGIAYAQNGQLDAAIREYQEVLRINPNCAEAHRSLGQSHMKKGDWGSAMKEFQEALKINPHNAGAHLGVGIVFMRKGESDAALAEFQESVRINPNYSETHQNLGIAYFEKGQLDAAMKEFQEALRIDPKDAKPHIFVGSAYRKKGDEDAAMKEFQEALKINPHDAEAHRLLGNSYQLKGDVDAAMREFQEALVIEPHDAAAYLGLGAAYHGRGRLREALGCYESFVRLAPARNAAQIRYVEQVIRQLKQNLTGE